MELQSGAKIQDLQVNPPGNEGVKKGKTKSKFRTLLK